MTFLVPSSQNNETLGLWVLDDEVTMMPNTFQVRKYTPSMRSCGLTLTRELVEVCIPILLIVLIGPEVHGHRRVRPCTDKFTWLAGTFDILAVEVEDLDGHTQRLGLNFWSTCKAETSNNIGDPL